jgi:hypothetical protein
MIKCLIRKKARVASCLNSAGKDCPLDSYIPHLIPTPRNKGSTELHHLTTLLCPQLLAYSLHIIDLWRNKAMILLPVSIQSHSSRERRDNAEANQLFETAEQFLKHHEGTVYRGAYSKDVAVKAAFSDSSFYLPNP